MTTRIHWLQGCNDQGKDNADTIVKVTPIMTVDAHDHDYIDKDNAEIDEVARRQRRRQS